MGAMRLNFHDETGFKSLLQTLMSHKQGGSFGRMHMVCVKPDNPNQVGLDWPHLLPKVQAIAEDVLRHRLNNDDACFEMDPGRYLLLFPRLSEVEGHVRATAISQAIKSRLVGENSKALDVVTNVLPLEILRQQALANQTPHADPLHQMDHTLEQQGHRQTISLQVHFQPVWSAEMEEIMGNRLRIHRHFGGQDLYESSTMLAGEQDPFGVSVNDALCKAGEHLPVNYGMVFMPVAINTHVLDDYEHFLSHVENVAQSMTSGQLVVELAAAIAVTPRPQVRRVINDILRLGAKVGVRVMPERESARFFRDCGAEYLCLNESQAVRAGFTHSAVYALFTLVGREVDGMGYHLCLWNASTPEDIKRASALGFEYFTGSPIGATTEQPSRPRQVPTDRIYR